MTSLSLLYHDVVADGQLRSSGFSSPDADIYKLSDREFRRHLEAINRRGVAAADRLFTFDDGGASALEPTATLLEAYGWKGRFFITTDFIGTSGFLSHDDIRALHRRGHIIGSHSCSHPPRMARCSRAELLREWGESREILSGILGETVDSASVPGGYYARAVAETAAQCGIQLLFTSEPTTRIHTVNSGANATDSMRCGSATTILAAQDSEALERTCIGVIHDHSAIHIAVRYK